MGAQQLDLAAGRPAANSSLVNLFVDLFICLSIWIFFFQLCLCIIEASRGSWVPWNLSWRQLKASDPLEEQPVRLNAEPPLYLGGECNPKGTHEVNCP